MFQYDDGISTVISEEGAPEEISVNIRKYAIDLTEEKWTVLRTRERERRDRRAINSTGSDRETKVKTISASGINIQSRSMRDKE